MTTSLPSGCSKAGQVVVWKRHDVFEIPARIQSDKNDQIKLRLHLSFLFRNDLIIEGHGFPQLHKVAFADTAAAHFTVGTRQKGLERRGPADPYGSWIRQPTSHRRCFKFHGTYFSHHIFCWRKNFRQGNHMGTCMKL